VDDRERARDGAGRVLIYASAPGQLPTTYTHFLDNPGPAFANGTFGTLP
jgi:hypothetical protein